MHHNALVRSLPIVLGAVGDTCGVEVTVGGDTAYTDGESVNIPQLPIDKASEELEMLAYGYLLHEAGHIRFTDFDAGKQVSTPLEKSILNLLEDMRIERGMMELFPGARRRLDGVTALVDAKDPWTPPANPAQAVTMFLQHEGRRTLLEQHVLDGHADKSSAAMKDTFSPGLCAKMATELLSVRSAESTEDCLAITRSIMQHLKDEQEQNPPSPKPDDTQDQQDQKTDPGCPSGTGQGQDQSPGQGSPAPDGSATPQPSPSAQAAAQALNASDADLPSKDRADKVAEQLGATAKDEAGPQESEAQVAGSASAPISYTSTPPDALAVRRTTATLTARLRGLLESKRRSSTSIGRRGSRLDTKRLYKIAMHDDRVFKSDHIIHGVNTAAYVLMDRSGSMTSIIDTTNTIAFGLVHALKPIKGLKVACGTFPVTGGTHRDNVATLTGFGETPDPKRYQIAASGGTPMMAALGHAALKLLKQPEPRKIVLVVTDGCPDNPTITAEAIAVMERGGIEVYGIGINHPAVLTLMPNKSCVVSNLAELPNAMFGLLQKAILKAA